jgi:23S rRNA pseudouridine1911/1915/1917 synthase
MRGHPPHQSNRPGGADDDVASSAGLLLPGGKVSEDALRAAIEQARENATGDEDDDALRTVRFELTRDLQKRLDKYLTDRIGFLSRTQLQRLIDEGGVKVNGRAPKASTKVALGDIVEVVIPEPPPKNIQPEDIPLDVLYEDDHLIVINKQPDIIVHPARSHLKGTMLSALAFHFKNRSRTGGDLSTVGNEFARPGVVHRLDRHTTGCIVFAKSDEAHWKLGHQFEHRRVDKRYIALVHGRVEPDVQPIDLPIGPHPSREKGYREKYVVRHDELGKHALTVCRVRETYTVHDANFVKTAAITQKHRDFSLVELELKTGRTHQIRVHLSELLWPIVADDMYGGKAFGISRGREGQERIELFDAGTIVPGQLATMKAPEGITPIIVRQALHAALLSFEHPITNQRMVFTAPLRGDLMQLVATLRAHSVVTPADPSGATVDVAAMIPA